MLEKCVYTQVSELHLVTDGTCAMKQENSALKTRLQVDLYIRENVIGLKKREKSLHMLHDTILLRLQFEMEQVKSCTPPYYRLEVRRNEKHKCNTQRQWHEEHTNRK